MTYPAQQGYAPQPQQYAPQQGYAQQAPPQQYAPQPQQAAPTGGPGMQISGATSGGGMSLRCFGVGRLVLIMPKREAMEDPHPLSKDTEQKRVLICDVVALDGGPITFGGKANSTGQMIEPDTMVVDPGTTGYFAQNVTIRGKGMAFSLDVALPSAANGFQGEGRVGRLWQDAAHGGAWKLTDNPPQDEVAKAIEWYSRLSMGQFVNPVPRPIAAQSGPPVNYGAQQARQSYLAEYYPERGGAPQGYPQQAPPQQYAPQGQAAPVQQQMAPGGYPQQAPQGTPPGYPAGAPQWPTQPPMQAPADPFAQQAPPQQYAPQAPAVPVQQQAAPAAPQGDPFAAVAAIPVEQAPPGYEQFWAAMVPAQRNHILTAIGDPRAVVTM